MHSPFRSESDVFRGVLLVAIGAAVAVLVGVLTDPAVGGIVAAGLLGLAIGATLRAGRGSLPAETTIAPRDRGAYRMLVLANQTVEGEELLGEIRDRAVGRDAVELLVVVPALTRSRLESITSDTDSARLEASERLEHSLKALRAVGLDARGSVGDEDPVQAARDALGEFGADEVIVSTHPPSRSLWLERGVVEQLRGEFELPLTHVVVRGAEPGSTDAAVAR
jgi:GABA permease